MKVYNKRYNPKLVLTALALCATTLIVGCSKKDDTKDLIGDGTKIIVNVMGITDMTEVPAKLKASAAEMPTIKDNEIMPKEMRSLGAFDAQVSLTKDELKQRPVSIGENVTSTLGSGQLMAAAMESGVTYRLVIYDASDNTVVSSTQLVSGTQGEVNVRKGGTYNWYAVSYNNTENIPHADETNPVINVPEASDLLYASGSITVDINAPDGNEPLGIVFAHKFSRIGLELNTMGMFANMNSVGVVVNGATGTTGTFDLINNTFTGSSTDPITVDFSDFENVDPLYGDRKIAYIYSSVETSTNLSVSINALDIQLDDGTNRVFSNLAASPVGFDFILTPQLGATYTAQMNFVESALTLDGVRWARQNLYYQGGHNPYRFHHTYAHTNARNTYFSFRGMVPQNFGSDSNDGDPCALVYPAGVWRQAEASDFRTLTGGGLLGGSGATETYGSVGSLGYIEYQAASGVAAPYPSNNLRFNKNGGGLSLGVVDGLVQLDLFSYGSEALVWSHDPGLDVLGLAWVGAYAYEGTGTSGNASTVLDVVQVGLLGIGVVESSFKNVRCVRN